MKEIKAYIRRDRVERVVAGLERAGAPGITIVEIHPVGYGYQPTYFRLRTPDAYASYAHVSVVKLELVCGDPDAERLVEVIETESRTGGKGDGRIFVSEVGTAVRIRDGARGPGAL